MTLILQYRPTESTLSSYIFYAIIVNMNQLCVLNGVLLHNYFQQGVLLMNILDLIRTRILERFPEIDPEELELRVEYAHEVIKHIRK